MAMPVPKRSGERFDTIAGLHIIAEASSQIGLALTSRKVIPSIVGLNWTTQRGNCPTVEQG
jgi:hypothetical protein